jgi:RNA polymerase sigma-70 factor, ECF subfamily
MDDESANKGVEESEPGRAASSPGLGDAPCATWQKGDAAAFAALVRRWQQPVARFLAAILGRNDLVPDLCQEVFLRVFLARARYRETGAFSSWLYRITLNVARDAGRRRLDPQPLPNQEISALAPFRREAKADCLSHDEHEELAQAIALGLAELPLPLRQVVVLRHYEDMKFTQMAQMLGIPPSTLRSRFEVGMTKLRVFLKQRGWTS